MSASVEPDGARLTLQGRITAGNVLGVRRRGEGWLATLAPGTQAVIDLSALTSASSVLLSLLLCLHRCAGRRRVEISFVQVPDDLSGLAQLNGVSRWLTGP